MLHVPWSRVDSCYALLASKPVIMERETVPKLREIKKNSCHGKKPVIRNNNLVNNQTDKFITLAGSYE